jgi:predicted nucleic acid-binding protein
LSLSVVDTSAWVSFFRGDPAAVRRIDSLLADGVAAITGAVLAEVLSGAGSRSEVDRLKDLFAGLERLPDPPDLWDRVAEARYTLARKGHQASLVDLVIALTCLDAGHNLVTRDRDFRAISRVVPLEVEIF